MSDSVISRVMPESMAVRQYAPSGRRTTGRLAMVALGALALAGCSVVPKVEAPPPVVTAPAPTVAPGLPVDLDRHRVALLVPQTGPNADIGASIANTTTLALLDTRSERVRITTYDTARGAAAAAQQAIADGNRLILGPLLSENVTAVAPIARAAGVPVVSFSNDVSVAGNGTLVMGFVPGQSVERVVAYAASQGLRRFGALVPNSPYGERSAAALRGAISASGSTLVAMERYDRSATAITGAARRLSAAGAMDAVLFADSGNNAGRVVALVNDGGQRRVLGTELWNAEAALGTNPAMRGAWYASVSDGLYCQMATKYRSRFGRDPFRLASLGYDATLLTVRIARDWQPGTAFPTSRLLAADGFGGLDGIFRFDQRGIARRALQVNAVAPVGTTVVDPAPTRW